MLDSDLAKLYGIETRVLKQAVRRNIGRFPDDFMMELNLKEYAAMLSSSRSQFVTLDKSGRGTNAKYKPFVFTELGVAMLSSVLNSETAIPPRMSAVKSTTNNYSFFNSMAGFVFAAFSVCHSTVAKAMAMAMTAAAAKTQP